MRHLRMRGCGKPFIHRTALVSFEVTEAQPAQLLDRNNFADGFRDQRKHLPQPTMEEHGFVTDDQEMTRPRLALGAKTPTLDKLLQRFRRS